MKGAIILPTLTQVDMKAEMEGLWQEDDDDQLDEYKWGLAIACPNTISTGIHWRKDRCVYEMGKAIDYNAVYTVTGKELSLRNEKS